MSEPLTGISSMATRALLAELVDAYALRCGFAVNVISTGGVDAARRVAAGEQFDFVVLASDAIARLEASGHVLRDSRVDLVHSRVAIAVPADAARPAIDDEAAVRRAVLGARSIGYSTGPSGAHLLQLFQRWGITNVIAPRIVQAPPGVPVGMLLARGEVELGFQQLSELCGMPGIDVLGVLPSEIELVTVFSAAVCTQSRRPPVVCELLRFLASSDADAAKARHGMQPPRARIVAARLAAASAR